MTNRTCIMTVKPRGTQGCILQLTQVSCIWHGQSGKNEGNYFSPCGVYYPSTHWLCIIYEGMCDAQICASCLRLIPLFQMQPTFQLLAIIQINNRSTPFFTSRSPETSRLNFRPRIKSKSELPVRIGVKPTIFRTAVNDAFTSHTLRPVICKKTITTDFKKFSIHKIV